MQQLTKCIHFYIGCQTNKGQLIGVKGNSLFIESMNGKLVENHEIQNVGICLFLHLRQLDDLTREESNDLIKKGFNIGRPKGYSFAPEGFLYLLNLNVDLFGLIKAGYAKQLKSRLEQNSDRGDYKAQA